MNSILTKLTALILLPAVILTLCSCSSSTAAADKSTRIPVILDTDICDDIDDTWALALLLKSPEFDIKLITTEVGDTPQRTKLVAKMLELAGRTDIPIGTGVRAGDTKKGHAQDEWTKDYDLSTYPGTIHDDGVQALIDTIMNSTERITLIAIGPVPNLAEALKREPRIAEKVNFVGMHGSIKKGYGGKDTPDPEYNVVAFVPAARKVFTADWPMKITPLDTCGTVQLRGEKYQQVLKSDDPLARAVIENYRAWTKSRSANPAQVERASSTLFDTVAIYMAVSTDLLEMQTLPIRVTDKGYTVIDEDARTMQCAMNWKDLDAYYAWLADRLTN
jgi:inosine-uridine nucleoside N-ribohydrolase